MADSIIIARGIILAAIPLLMFRLGLFLILRRYVRAEVPFRIAGILLCFVSVFSILHYFPSLIYLSR